MSKEKIITRFRKFHQKLNGSTVEYDTSRYNEIINLINIFTENLAGKNDKQLKQFSKILIKKGEGGEDPDKLLPEAFALVREAIKRVLNITPFDSQIIGGICLHNGRLIEMQTGEGKTLTAVFAAYLNALSGKGVHILTFNDYLAKRDAVWMAPVYELLGLSVGYVSEKMGIAEKQNEYKKNITYLTAKEAGFDYLRDNLCYNPADIVHRKFNFAIIDEADSILIDEARIPLIIAEANIEDKTRNILLTKTARNLEKEKDFEFDENDRNIILTESGLKKAESKLNCGSLYDINNIDLLIGLNCALHAEYLLKKDVDYIVRNNKIELVDEFTGRVALRRRWPDGLQEALEAKENIINPSKGKILNSIAIQHFIRLYSRICGMTATALPAESEFREFYNLHITLIPPHIACIRTDNDDIIFNTKKEKKKAVVDEIIAANKRGQPVLAGTRSVGESSELAEMLMKQGIKCEVLNAMNDEKESAIIALAGKAGAVTISTNMAGRGTDIKLVPTDQGAADSRNMGGLYVIGTNRHESRRIDDQLRGRAGRQGDPGVSWFFVSLEDDLFVKFRLKDLIKNNANIRKEINRIQRIIEGQNLEIKKTLYKYSIISEQQRKIISEKREGFLLGEENKIFFQENSAEKYSPLLESLGEENLSLICRRISLFIIDNYWCRYLAEIADLRECIHFRRIGGEDPFTEFNRTSVRMFDELLEIIENEMLRSFNELDPEEIDVNEILRHFRGPASTWTYLINDDPFSNMPGIQFAASTGLSAIAGFMWPLMLLNIFINKIYKKKKAEETPVRRLRK